MRIGVGHFVRIREGGQVAGPACRDGHGYKDLDAQIGAGIRQHRCWAGGVPSYEELESVETMVVGGFYYCAEKLGEVVVVTLLRQEVTGG